MPQTDPGIVPDWPAPQPVRALQGTVTSGLPADLPSDPCWLEQVHGCEVVWPRRGQQGLTGDAAVTAEPGTVLAIRTADCVPVLFCAIDGSVVAAAHAGWRGLVAGIIEQTVAAMERPGTGLLAWIGPCIGQDAFEIGPEVRAELLGRDPGGGCALRAGEGDRWHADLVTLTKRRLLAAGITAIHGGDWCTYSDPERFHSYRRTGGTGRMATLVWMEV